MIVKTDTNEAENTEYFNEDSEHSLLIIIRRTILSDENNVLVIHWLVQIYISYQSLEIIAGVAHYFVLQWMYHILCHIHNN